jgi:3-methyladenine DNA glycosylase/8-oxoguanine DNA glycosylase
MKLVLSARQPFLFHSVIHSHGWYQLAPLQWDNANATLRKAERLENGRVALVTIRGDDSTIQVETPGRLQEREIAEIRAKFSWMFQLEADFSEFYALADQEPRLAHCRGKAQGRLLRSTSLFEDVVKVMATTNIQWGGAKRLVQRLVSAFGEPLPADETVRAFPTPARIAASDETTLRELGWGYRSPYLLKLARGIVTSDYDLDALLARNLPTVELRKTLLKLPGIGPYAAATLLGILGRYDYIGVDTEAISAVSQAFYGGQSVGEKEINAVFERWGSYKALAYWFWDWSGAQKTPMEAWEAGEG